MVTAAIFVPDTSTPDAEFAQDCMTHIGHSGYTYTGLVLHDRAAVERCLRERTAEVVIVARREHRIAGLPIEVARAPLARIVSLDRRRDETATRRISRNYSDRHRPSRGGNRRDEVGMTTGQIRRILTGEEQAPAAIDPMTVDAIRSIASRLGFK